MQYPTDRTDYTFGEYYSWTDDGRWEIINGVLYDLTPTPLVVHQEVLGNLAVEFLRYLEGNTGQVYMAPLDCRLPEKNESDEESSNVVQPDIVVFCNPDHLDERGGTGPFDLAVEIVMPWTAKKDMTVKYDLYERFGVKNYWIVFPRDGIVMIYILGENGKYGKADIYSEHDKIDVDLFEDLTIDLNDVFSDLITRK